MYTAISRPKPRPPPVFMATYPASSDDLVSIAFSCAMRPSKSRYKYSLRAKVRYKADEAVAVYTPSAMACMMPALSVAA